MKLNYTITTEDYRQGLRLYDSALAPGRWLRVIAEPLAFLALGFGFYAYVTGSRPMALSLFASFGYLFTKGFLLRFSREFLAIRKRTEPQHMQLETSEQAISVSALGTTSSGLPSVEKGWSEFRGYAQSAEVFVLSLGRTFHVIPKRSLTSEQVSEFQAILSSKLRPAKAFTGMLALRRAVSLILLGYIGFFFFGGTLERGVAWALRPFSTRQATRGSAFVALSPAASPSQLHGFGYIYLVPIGDTAPLLSPSILQYYKSKYGLTLHMLPAMPVPDWARDEGRKQLVADELIAAMRRAYPKQGAEPDSIFVGLTDEDMYIAELDWQFALNFRQTPRELVISTARLNPVFYGKRPEPALLETRLRKLLTKNIGITYYGLRLSRDPASVLYQSIEDMETLDAMGEDYSVTDARARQREGYEDGDPCFLVRHYYSPNKQRTDSAYLSSCSSTHGETDLEVLELYLRYGMLLSRRSDFYLPGSLPLELSRVIRTQDSRSRAFGIGGNHSLNILPVGNAWPFTWMDLVLEDGGRYHYRRANWGGSYWDAVYVVEPTITDFYSSYISWNWPGWKLFRRDGRTYIFPDGGGTQVPEQASLIGVQDASGHALRLQRQSNGNLVSASSAEGAWIHFRYDDLRRVSEAKDSAGHELLYGYNAAGCLEEVEDADHHVTQYGHQGARCPTSMTVDHRQVWDAKLDEGARVTELTLADVGTYHFTYSLDSSGAATRIDIRDPGGNVLRLTYYSSGYRLDHLTKGNALAALH